MFTLTLLRFKPLHCDLKVANSCAKIYENYASYFFKTIAKNKCFVVLKCTWFGLQRKQKS